MQISSDRVFTTAGREPVGITFIPVEIEQECLFTPHELINFKENVEKLIGLGFHLRRVFSMLFNTKSMLPGQKKTRTTLEINCRHCYCVWQWWIRQHVSR